MATDNMESVQLVTREEAAAMLRLGVIKPETDQFSAYLAWGSIIDDPWLTEKCCEWATVSAPVNVPAHDIRGVHYEAHSFTHRVPLSRIEAIKRITPAERVALRDRILGVLPFVPPVGAKETADTSDEEEV